MSTIIILIYNGIILSHIPTAVVTTAAAACKARCDLCGLKGLRLNRNGNNNGKICPDNVVYDNNNHNILCDISIYLLLGINNYFDC